MPGTIVAARVVRDTGVALREIVLPERATDLDVCGLFIVGRVVALRTVVAER